MDQVQGKDVNLGRHVSEDAAARAYDKAAICARGKEAAKLNFDISDYESELEQLEAQTVAQLAPVLRYTDRLISTCAYMLAILNTSLLPASLALGPKCWLSQQAHQHPVAVSLVAAHYSPA